ncbi:leucyl/phenylalanyl-tRNA--protein transferase [Campylobacterota bacterium]|nr:leucyl/phenylalanyl-tRNA--protein transferase [Campylobacterota bacterium]
MHLIRKKPPVFFIENSDDFPDQTNYDFDDLICVGGDLSPDRLVAAYTNGIFPWFIEDGFPYWFSPKIRMILEEFRLSKSQAKTIRNSGFRVEVDRDFLGVMNGCATPRKTEKTSWITDEYFTGYCALHKVGVAHSVETYLEDQLVGGLYGVAIGRAFFGESMFALERDSSKVALHALSKMGFDFIDCQVPSAHLASLGGYEISRNQFLAKLRNALNKTHATISFDRMDYISSNTKRGGS